MVFRDLYQINRRKGNFYKEIAFKFNYPKYYTEIIDFCNINNLPNLPFKIKIYHFLYDLKFVPQCKTCGGITKFQKQFAKGYRDFCSNSCVNKSDLIKSKIKKTFVKKYGVDNPMKNNDILSKVQNTNLDRYGFKCSLQSEIVRTKTKKTINQKYGVDNVFQNEKIKEKSLINYGFEYPNQSNIVKSKIKETNIKKYGVDSFSKTEQYKSQLRSTNIEKLIKKIGNEYELLSITDDQVTLHHKLCNSKFIINRNLLNLRYSRENVICGKCNNIEDGKSNGEVEIGEFLKSKNINFIEKNNKLIPPYEIDIFLPDYNIGIEYNGIYFHSDKFKNKEYHFNKWKMASDKGITLIQIFEDEWKNKSEIVKSILLNKLNLTDKKIYGRKCVVSEIDNKTYSNFLIQNHLQGNCVTTYRIGLYYGTDLVSVMGISGKRIALGNSKDGILEITRFANKCGYSIIGGFAKLCSYVINSYDFTELISFSDLRYFDGKIYEKNNFKFSHITKPNYWYVKDGIRYHRYNFTKHKLVKKGFNPNLTENKIMSDNKFYKIWDCGNMKWSLSKIDLP